MSTVPDADSLDRPVGKSGDRGLSEQWNRPIGVTEYAEFGWKDH